MAKAISVKPWLERLGVAQVKHTEKEKPVSEKGEKKYLLTDASYQRLTQAQREISEVHGISPSLKTLLNTIITEESVTQAKECIKQKLDKAMR